MTPKAYAGRIGGDQRTARWAASHEPELEGRFAGFGAVDLVQNRDPPRYAVLGQPSFAPGGELGQQFRGLLEPGGKHDVGDDEAADQGRFAAADPRPGNGRVLLQLAPDHAGGD